MKTTYNNKGKTTDEILWFWEDKIAEYKIPLIEPKYTDDEKFIKKIKGAGGLRKSEPDIYNKAEHYLVLKEAMRRYLDGRFTRVDNYAKLVVRSFERLHEKLLNENLELAGDFTPKPGAGGDVDGNFNGRFTAGMEIDGKFYISYFRMWRPWEEYMIIQPIGSLKYIWNRRTRKRGDAVAITSNELRVDAITRIRQEWIETGYVNSLIDEVNRMHPDLVPLNDAVKSKLVQGFKGSNRPVSIKSIPAKTVVVEPVIVETIEEEVKELTLLQKFLNLFK